MSHRIVNKTTNNVIGVVENNDDEFIDELIKANDGKIEDYVVEEFIEMPPAIEKQKEQQRQAILIQLAELDKVITRTEEQFKIDNNLVCTYQPILDAIAQKQILRQQLQELEV